MVGLLDEAELAEALQEIVHARPRGADHVGQHLLRDVRADHLRRTFGDMGEDGQPVRQTQFDDEPAFAQLFMAHLMRHNAQIEAEKVNLLFADVFGS